MWTVIVRSYFNHTHCDNTGQHWYSYGPFNTFGAASIWACSNLDHLSDDCWYIAQHINIPTK